MVRAEHRIFILRSNNRLERITSLSQVPRGYMPAFGSKIFPERQLYVEKGNGDIICRDLKYKLRDNESLFVQHLSDEIYVSAKKQHF